MKSTNRLKVTYSATALALVLALGACSPKVETEAEAVTEAKTSEQEVVTGSLEENTETEVVEENSATASSEIVTKGNARLPKYLPADFPLPDDAEIETSRFEQNEGKKSVLLIMRTKEDMVTITSMYTTYIDTRNLEDATEITSADSITIRGESPTNSESWAIIGGSSDSMDGVIDLTIRWEEL